MRLKNQERVISSDADTETGTPPRLSALVSTSASKLSEATAPSITRSRGPR
ncbi:hypothetical protein [Streptomyces sp. 21So2-11]|uniref:hypothetical protein n=1 Tax=Streptomyces sp. 21So2-11 TaxID=3144408 RepID=UPI00321AB878